MKHRVLGGLHSLRSLAPGSALAVVVALAASFVSQLHGGPQMLYALFFGVAFHYLSQEQRTKQEGNLREFDHMRDIEHFQAKRNRLATREMRSNKGLVLVR